MNGSNIFKLSKVVRVEEEKCVNCHHCISACPVKYCNDGSGNTVVIRDDLCIGCGECIKACAHQARVKVDDFALALDALQNGEKVVAIVAPAVAANFPGMYLNLNGWLKASGVAAVFDVSFGAELTIKSYLEFIKEKNPKLVISQPCPVLVTYIEIYKPELLPYLAPADSPMTHTMKMIRHYYTGYRDYKFMVISPCMAKRREFDETGIGDFNVTMSSLQEHFKINNIYLADYPAVGFDNEPAERAVLFSTPGGLLRTAQREFPDIINHTRKIEGPAVIYRYLKELQESMKNGVNPLLVDCLNCEMGCNGGTGTTTFGDNIDKIESHIEKRNRDMREHYEEKGNRRKKNPSLGRIRKTVDRYWKKGLYDRSYRDLSSNFKELVKIPEQKEIIVILEKMNKREKRDIKDCPSCGYNKCENMVIAVFNGYNNVENCHFYLNSALSQKEAVIRENSRSLLGNIENLTMQISSQYTALSQLMNSFKSMIESITDTKKMTDGNKVIVDFLVKITEESDDKVTRTRQVLKEISDNTGSVLEMIKLMNNITARINILALNASIEATHAGQFGRGFSIVASEVRKLGESAINSTKGVSQSLMETIRKMESSIQSGNETHEAFSRINTEVKGVAGTFNTIINDMTKLYDQSEEILKTIDVLSRAADEVKISSDEMKRITASFKNDVAV